MLENKNEQEQRQKLIAHLQELLKTSATKEFLSIFSEKDPDEIAQMLELLGNPDEIAQVLDNLPVSIAAETLVLLPGETISAVLDIFSAEKIAQLAQELPSDDATDLIGFLDKEKASQVLQKLPKQEREEIKSLITHPAETAGALMEKELEKLPGSYTVAQAIADLVRFGDEIDEIYQIYVVDYSGKLIGAIPIQRLLLVSPGLKLSDIATPVDVVVSVNSDKEYVADLFRRKDIVSAPVVDENGKLVGRITIDDVLDVVDNEASEDIYKMAGIEFAKEDTASAIHKIRTRISWILIAFLGEIVAGYVLKSFCSISKEFIACVVFAPLIMAMGGTTGIQSAAVVIRKLALSRHRIAKIHSTISKEISAGLVLGLLCSILAFGFGILWGSMKVGIIAGISLFLSMILSSMVGAALPAFLAKIKRDPAFAADPFITTFSDITSLAIYLFVAMGILMVWK